MGEEQKAKMVEWESVEGSDDMIELRVYCHSDRQILRVPSGTREVTAFAEGSTTDLSPEAA